MDCIFCKIIKGEISSYTIYEDEQIKVILDIEPGTNGDSLIIPKKHIETFLDLDEKLLLHIHQIAQKLYPIYKEKLHCDGLTLVQNNDYGQDIKHYHLHLTPRYKDDDLHQHYNKSIIRSLEEIYEILKK